MLCGALCTLSQIFRRSRDSVSALSQDIGVKISNPAAVGSRQRMMTLVAAIGHLCRSLICQSQRESRRAHCNSAVAHRRFRLVSTYMRSLSRRLSPDIEPICGKVHVSLVLEAGRRRKNANEIEAGNASLAACGSHFGRADPCRFGHWFWHQAHRTHGFLSIAPVQYHRQTSER